MSFLKKIFKEKEEKPVIDYSKLTQSLFQSYLINSFSKQVASTGEFNFNFTEIAHYSQSLRFFDYCQYLLNGYPVASGGNYNIEYMNNTTARNYLLNPQFDTNELLNYCDEISTIYECALATSSSIKDKLLGQGEYEQAKSVELTSNIVDNLSENYDKDPVYAFTSKSFDRCGIQTIDSARDTITSMEQECPGVVKWGLSVISDGSAVAERAINTMHRDFEFHTEQTE